MLTNELFADAPPNQITLTLDELIRIRPALARQELESYSDEVLDSLYRYWHKMRDTFEENDRFDPELHYIACLPEASAIQYQLSVLFTDHIKSIRLQRKEQKQ